MGARTQERRRADAAWPVVDVPRPPVALAAAQLAAARALRDSVGGGAIHDVAAQGAAHLGVRHPLDPVFP
jgi:hypothetical protein